MSPPKKRYQDLSKALRDNLLRRKSQTKARNKNNERAEIAKKNSEHDEFAQCDDVTPKRSELQQASQKVFSPSHHSCTNIKKCTHKR